MQVSTRIGPLNRSTVLTCPVDCAQNDGVLRTELEKLREKNAALEATYVVTLLHNIGEVWLRVVACLVFSRRRGVWCSLKQVTETHDEVQAARIRVCVLCHRQDDCDSGFISQPCGVGARP